MKFALCLVAAVAATAVAGCSKDPAEKMVSMMEDMADVVDKNKDDCDKLAEKLGAWVEKNKSEMKSLAESLSNKNMSKEDEKALEAKYKDRMEKAQAKAKEGRKKCSDNEKVKSALREAF